MKYFKSKETKKFLGFFMALAMIISMMPGVASAQKVTLGTNNIFDSTVSGAAVKVNASDVTVTGGSISDFSFDVTVTTTSAITSSTLTITVNEGYSVSSSALKCNNTDVKFADGKASYTEKFTGEIKFILTGSVEIVKAATPTESNKPGNGGNGGIIIPNPGTTTTPSESPSAPAGTTAPPTESPSAPADTTAPSDTPSAPADTTAPSESVAPEESAAPTKKPTTVKVGTKKTVNGAKYKVTKGNKVTYTAPSKKTAKVTIPATVKINGVTCKVTTIGKGAFKGNTKIKTVSLGKNITKIEANAFKGCKNLKTITIKSTSLTKKNVAKTAFKGINKKATFKVPAKKVKAYKTVVKYAGAPKTVKVKK